MPGLMLDLSRAQARSEAHSTPTELSTLDCYIIYINWLDFIALIKVIHDIHNGSRNFTDGMQQIPERSRSKLFSVWG